MPRVKKITEEKLNTLEPLMPGFVVNRSSSSTPTSSFRYLPWILIVLVVISAGIFVFKQQQNAVALKQELEELKQNPQNAADEETKALVEKVGQLIELPNEQPTVATVTDLAALKDQPFFDNAQVNDQVLIYTIAKKAVLYRPSTNKVIEVAPVNLDSTPKTVNTNKNTNSATTTNSSNTSNSNKNTNSTTNSNSNKNTNTVDNQ